MHLSRQLLLATTLLLPWWSAHAEFSSGPVFEKFGRKTLIEGVSFDKTAHFAVAFDIASGATPGAINRKFESAARFMNMHVASGVPQENIKLAIVVHGSATLDVLKDSAYRARLSESNATIPLLRALMSEHVQVMVCGQSMMAQDVTPAQLLDGVSVSLSAMTAHALLQQQGYTVNPF